MDEADVKSEQFGQERGAQALPKQFVVDFFLERRRRRTCVPLFDLARNCIYEMQRCNSFGRARFAFGMMCGGMARTDSRQMSASRRRCAFRLRLSNLDCESGQFDLPQLWTKRQQRTRQQSNEKKQNRKQNRAASQFVRAAWGFQQEMLESTR